MKSKAKERIREIAYNNYGSKMIIIDYKDNKNVKVKFEDDYITFCNYKDFKNGYVKSPYEKRIFNHGFIGEGKYKSKKNGKSTKKYHVWYDILERCYYKNYQNKYSQYKDCFVCDEWHNFQNFAEWFNKNYYKIPNEKMEIDKDILFKNNKVYSPMTCIIVPSRINRLFIRQHNGLPPGVYFNKEKNKYCVTAQGENCKTTYLGYFNSKINAFYAYKKHKKKIIKKVAEKYKNKIPKKLYKAMINYKIEIND